MQTQEQMNKCVELMADVCFDPKNTARLQRVGRLRNCSAEVFKDKDCGTYYLKSYSTFVAMIAPTGEVIDALRYVYGYTATSAQHIAKFMKDYGGTGKRYTWKEVK